MQIELISKVTRMFIKFETAFSFANKKHKNQRLPGSGLPYISHISNVCFELLLLPSVKNYDSEFLLVVAALHDTLEDTDASEEEIEKFFGGNVLSAVKSLSKNYALPKETQIKDSIERILKEPVEVHLVKLADRITNLNLPPQTWAKEKIIKYYDSSCFIYDKLKNANDFLAKKLLEKIIDYRQYC